MAVVHVMTYLKLEVEIASKDIEDEDMTGVID